MALRAGVITAPEHGTAQLNRRRAAAVVSARTASTWPSSGSTMPRCSAIPGHHSVQAVTAEGDHLGPNSVSGGTALLT